MDASRVQASVVTLRPAIQPRRILSPWPTLVEAYRAQRAREGKRPATLRLDLDNLFWTQRQLEAATDAPADPRTVSRKSLEHLIDRMLQDARKASTVNKRIVAWHGFFGFLVREGHMRENPSAALVRMREDVPSVEHLDPVELRALVRFIRDRRGSLAQLRLRALIGLIIDCGLRLAEAQRARLDGLDPERRVLHLPGEATKNRRPRNLPLGALSLGYLDEYLQARRRYRDASPLLLAGVDGKPFNRDATWTAMGEWIAAAGIRRRVTPHVLRHTFAVNYLVGGGDAHTLQKIMGHLDPRVLDQYLQFRDGELGLLRARADPTAALSDLIELDEPEDAGGLEVPSSGRGAPVRRRAVNGARGRTAVPRTPGTRRVV